jgi:hypothetical protein
LGGWHLAARVDQVRWVIARMTVTQQSVSWLP